MRSANLLNLAILFLCSSCNDADRSEEPAVEVDPVFELARRDPQLRRILENKVVKDSLSNSQFKRQLRAELSERLYEFPKPRAVSHLESLLQSSDCVGDIRRWNRTYSNGLDEKRGGIDPAKIRFRLIEAGKLGIRPARHIVASSRFPTIDDRPFRVVYGTYDVASSRITIEFCGQN